MELKRILIVEDELIIAHDLQMILERLGFQVAAIAATGSEAIDKAVSCAPDLILMDIVLDGDMDGIEAARRIVARDNIPIVFLTGNADMQTVRQARDSQPYGYVLKPVHTQDLFSTIDTALEHHRLEIILQNKSNELEAANEELEATNRELILSQESLQESEKRLKSIIDCAPFGAHLYELRDDRLLFIGFNEAADRILNLDHRQFIGKSIEEAFPPLRETEIPDAYRRVARTGERYSSEQVDYDNAGIRGAFEINAFQTGRNLMAVFFRDITERKRAEEALCMSEERYRELFEGITDTVFLHEALPDRPGKFLAVNDRACRALGYSREELLAMSVADIDVPEQTERIPGIMQRLFREGSDMFETSHLTKDGRRIPVEVNVRLLNLQGNAVILSVSRDISERKRARHYLDVAEVMMVALDARGVITLVNRKGCAILGYAEKDLLGRDWFDACVPAAIRDNVREVFGMIMTGATEQAVYYENPVVTASGEERVIAWNNAILRDEFGMPNGTLSTGSDITERGKK